LISGSAKKDLKTRWSNEEGDVETSVKPDTHEER